MKRRLALLLLLATAACAQSDHNAVPVQSGNATAYIVSGTVWSPGQHEEDATAKIDEQATAKCGGPFTVTRLETFAEPRPTGYLYMGYRALVQCTG